MLVDPDVLDVVLVGEVAPVDFLFAVVVHSLCLAVQSREVRRKGSLRDVGRKDAVFPCRLRVGIGLLAAIGEPRLRFKGPNHVAKERGSLRHFGPIPLHVDVVGVDLSLGVVFEADVSELVEDVVLRA